MSANSGFDFEAASGDSYGECRTEIKVRGMHWAGVRAEKTDKGDAGKQTRDSEDPDKVSPPNMIINGTAVFVKDRFRKDSWSLHEDSCFSGRGIDILPAKRANSYVSFTPTINGGKVNYAEGDETEWKEKPSIHFSPIPDQSKDISPLKDLYRNEHGTVVGRDERGHLLADTDDTFEREKMEAEVWDSEILFAE